MPRGDGTGPNGAGAMTGRAAGYCAGFDRPGFANFGGFGGGGFGRGRGFGRGMGMGRRFAGYPQQMPMYNQPQPTAEQELNFLKNQASALNEELDSIKSRIEQLEK